MNLGWTLPPQTLLSSIDFDVNAVMWCWDRQWVMESSCVDAISRKVMDFNTTLVFDRVLLAYRILVTHHKTGFSLSENIFNYVKTAIDLEILKRLKRALISKMGKPKAREVMKCYNRICRCKSYKEHFASSSH